MGNSRGSPAAVVHVLTLLALLAGSLAPVLVASSPAAADGMYVDVPSGRYDIVSHPDHVRVGWKSGGDPVTFSVRDNDELAFRRCVEPYGNSRQAKCEELTATCGAVVDDMEELFDTLDELSAKLKESWDDQKISTGETPNTAPHFKLPDYGQTSQIGLAQLLQAAWPLLPLRYMFLNWDMEFVADIDVRQSDPTAIRLEAALTDETFKKIVGDHKIPGDAETAWGVRSAGAAKAEIHSHRDAGRPSDVAKWVTNRDTAAEYRFPAFTLGALLKEDTLARQVPAGVPDVNTAFGYRLNALTGGATFDTWVQGLEAKTDGREIKTALGHRISDELTTRLGGDAQSVTSVKDHLKNELIPDAKALHSRIGMLDGGRSAGVPYTVRATLAFLKIIADDSAALSGFSGSRSYRPYQFPLLVFLEAPDLTFGLLELFGLPRPEYRSVRDLRFVTGSIVYYEERAESLLLDMFEVCTEDFTIKADRFLRVGDPYAEGDAGTGVVTAIGRAAGGEFATTAGSQSDPVVKLSKGPEGSLVSVTPNALGETTLWYCYAHLYSGIELRGCSEPWTPVTLLLEPAANDKDGLWDDARVVIQRDHFHIVVDWSAGSSGRVLVLRPTPAGTIPLTTTGQPNYWASHGISNAGRWVHDAHVRDYMPQPTGSDGNTGHLYEIVSEFCCLDEPSAGWSFEVELPVMDNDEVHFYDKENDSEPLKHDVNELRLLEGSVTCDTSRYCENLGVHHLDRRVPPAEGFVDVTDRASGDSVTVRIGSRRGPDGAVKPVFADGTVKHRFDRFWLSYCVSAFNVTCRTFTDRRVFSNETFAGPNRGHCVVATSFEQPVAPNAPSQLSVREWAVRNGRPPGDFYFARDLTTPKDEDLKWSQFGWQGWDNVQFIANDTLLRNYDCPAVDPQKPDLRSDWGDIWTRDDIRPRDYAYCASTKPGDDRTITAKGRTGGPLDHAVYTRDTKSFADDATNEYKAYRRFWTCANTKKTDNPSPGHPIVGGFDKTNNRAGHPTDHNVFVTLEFINTTGTSYCKDPTTCPDPAEQRMIDANCASVYDKDSRGPVAWGTRWKIDPGKTDDRKIPKEWCYPLVACWTDEARRMLELGGPSIIGQAGCPHTPRPDTPWPPLWPRGCSSYLQVLEPDLDKAPVGCKLTGFPQGAASNFALNEGCIRPSITTQPPPGYGVLRAADPRLSDINTALGAEPRQLRGFRHFGGLTLPLLPVGTALALDPARGFCQGASMRVVGVWPTWPGDPPTWDDHPQWPEEGTKKACDGNDDPKDPDYHPRLEIDEVCERSYPLLYDSNKNKPGIQLSTRWTRCLNEVPGKKDETHPAQRCTEAVPGCVGATECANWAIPQPGFYQVRIEVDMTDEVMKRCPNLPDNPQDCPYNADYVLRNLPGTSLSAGTYPEVDKLIETRNWGAVSGNRTAGYTVKDPDPFVFDTIIWAQALFPGAA